MSEALESVRSYAKAWPSMSVWAMTMLIQGQGCAECPTTPPGPCPMWLSPTSMWTPLPPTPWTTATTSQWLVTTSPCWPLSPPTRCSVEKFTPSQGMKQSLIDVCEMVLIYCCPAGPIPVFLTLKRSMSSHSALATMTLTVMLTSTVIQVSCNIWYFHITKKSPNTKCPGEVGTEIILQHHDKIVTSGDIGLHVSCVYNINSSVVYQAMELGEELQNRCQPAVTWVKIIIMPCLGMLVIISAYFLILTCHVENFHENFIYL